MDIISWTAATLMSMYMLLGSQTSNSDYVYNAEMQDGKIIKDDYTYLASTWATPVLILEYEEEIECYVMQSKTKYRHDTKWPQSAIDILKGAGDEQ